MSIGPYGERESLAQYRMDVPATPSAEKQLRRARLYVSRRLFKGQIGAGEDVIGNMITICEWLIAEAEHERSKARLGNHLLDRAKEACRAGRIDEWTQATLEEAEKLGAGQVKLVPYRPDVHGELDAAPGQPIWWWGEESVDRTPVAGEAGP